MRKNSSKLALFSVLIAICLALQLLPRPPNVEFTSFFVFLVGFIFGSLAGILFGGFVMFVNGFFSPWGFAGLNMPFQMIGMGIVGLAGGLYKKFSKDYALMRFCEVAVLGAFLTTLYDLITNIGFAFQLVMFAGASLEFAILTAIACGTPFSIVHVLSNTAVFGIVFSPLIKSINNILMVKNLG